MFSKKEESKNKTTVYGEEASEKRYPIMPKQVGKDESVRFKILITGEPGSGKSSLINNFLTKYETPKGSKQYDDINEVRNASVSLNERNISLSLFESITSHKTFENPYRGAHAIVVVCDQTDKENVYKAIEECSRAQRFCDSDCKIFLILNKSDQTKNAHYDSEELNAIAKRLDGLVEVSAKTGMNVSMAFEAILNSCMRPIIADEAYFKAKADQKAAAEIAQEKESKLARIIKEHEEKQAQMRMHEEAKKFRRRTEEEAKKAQMINKKEENIANAKDELDNYIIKRSDNTNTFTGISRGLFGYSKDKKLSAALTLKKVLNGEEDKSLLKNHEGPLSNGELGKIYKKLK